MPLHDWTRVPSGLFHDFHQTWCIQIKVALNRGVLPRGLSALVEQRMGQYEADVLAIECRIPAARSESPGGLQTLAPPRTSIIQRTSNGQDSDRANRIVIKHHLGRIVAVIEIVSPGNKCSRVALRDFVEKSVAMMRQGVHFLIVDMFPPTPRDPLGLHKLIWDEFDEMPFALPAGKDRVLASYEMAGEKVAYVEPLGLGDPLPAMPLFLAAEVYVPVPLEETYRQAWEATPEDLRSAVETGVLPGPETDL